MTAVNIKNNAQEAFKNKDYPKAFTTLWELGVEDFLQFSQKEDKKTKKFNWLAQHKRHKQSIPSSNYFWNTFIFKEHVFTTCFSSLKPVELLHNYYSKTTIFNQEFETKLAKEFPIIFIEAIKKNEVFFKEDRIDFLLKDNILTGDEYVIHQDVWECFQEIELKNWKQIEATILKIENYPLEYILFYCIAYFEANNFDSNFDDVNRQVLAENYSFFIDIVLRNKNIKQQNLSSEQFTIDFTDTIYQNKHPKLKTLLDEVFGFIAQRQKLNADYFQPYCYNSEFKVQYIYESLFFQESPESYYQWTIDGIRYKANEIIYNQKGGTILDYKLKNGAIIPSKKKEDYPANKILAYQLETTITLLKDLKLTNYYFKDVNKKNIKIGIEKVIPPLFIYAYNKLIRYYTPIQEIKETANINNWQKAHALLSTTNKESLKIPFIYITKEEYIALNSNAYSQFNDEISTHILNNFSFNRHEKLYKFNRFKVQYSVIETPFISFGDYIFSPVLFFINFTSHNTYINSLLKNNNSSNRQTAIEIEDRLEELLTIHDFKIKRLTQAEVKLIDGDADLILYDDESVLLMQLKRTNLRLDYKTQYYEYINVDLKASNQLNNAQKYLSKENTIFKIGNRKVTKWIVSNSFEKVNTKINYCLKVNYLDIVSFLNNDQGMTFDTLSKFIGFFETDSYFKNTTKYLIDEDYIDKNTLSLANMNQRSSLWYDIDTEKGKRYRYYYDLGIRLNAKGNYRKALKALKKCLELDFEYFEIHASIANIYADIKNYEKAFFHFTEALKIVPNEPLTKRNYAITLRESGNFNFMKVHSEIANTFPLLDLTE